MNHSERSTADSVEAYLRAHINSAEIIVPDHHSKVIPVTIRENVSASELHNQEMVRAFSLQVGPLSYEYQTAPDTTELRWKGKNDLGTADIKKIVYQDLPRSLHFFDGLTSQPPHVAWVRRESEDLRNFNLSDPHEAFELWNAYTSPETDMIHGNITSISFLGHEGELVWKFAMENLNDNTNFSLALASTPEYQQFLWNNPTLQQTIKTHVDASLLPETSQVESRFAERLRSGINQIQHPLVGI